MKRYFCLLAFIMSALAACLCRAECTVDAPEMLIDVILCDTTPRAILLTSSSRWGKGEFHVLDENSGNKLWTKKINYLTESVHIACDKYVMLMKPGAVAFYDIDSGDEVMKFKINPACIDKERDFIIGSRDSGGKKLEAYRLSSGEKLWESKLKGGTQGRWRLIDADTVAGKIILHGKNLCSVDYNTGDVNHYKLKTSVLDNRAIGMFIGAAVVTGFIGIAAGVAALPVGAGSIYSINELHSNVLIDSDRYFIADKKQVSCVDSDMNPVWKCPIEKNMGSQSSLYFISDTLYMVNFGVGYCGDGKCRYIGKPFYAAFNKSTGERYYCKQWPRKWDKSRIGRTLDWVTKPIYALDKEGKWFFPVVGAGRYNPLYGTNEQVHMVDGNLNIVESFHREDLYEEMANCGDCFLMRQLGESPDYFLVSHTGAVIHRFPDECSWLFADGRKLCVMLDDKLVFTDVDSVQTPKDNIQPGQLIAGH